MADVQTPLPEKPPTLEVRWMWARSMYGWVYKLKEFNIPQLYARTEEVEDKVETLEAKEKEQKKEGEDLEKRVRTLEDIKNKWMGAIWLGGLVASFVGSWLAKHI